MPEFNGNGGGSVHKRSRLPQPLQKADLAKYVHTQRQRSLGCSLDILFSCSSRRYQL